MFTIINRLVGSKNQAQVITIDLDCKRRKSLIFLNNAYERSTHEDHTLTTDSNLVTENGNGLSYNRLVGSKNQAQVVSIDLGCKRKTDF